MLAFWEVSRSIASVRLMLQAAEIPLRGRMRSAIDARPGTATPAVLVGRSIGGSVMR